MASLVQLVLNVCKIARRGKAAKGCVDVQTFGLPVIPKDATDGIARSFEYSTINSVPFRTAVDAVEKNFGRKINLTEALLRGVDIMNTQMGLKAQNETALLIKRIFAEDLAQDEKEAFDVAKAYRNIAASHEKSMTGAYSFEDFASKRRIYVDSQKALGLWKTRLVDNREDADSDDTDTDDSNEPDIALE